MNKLVNKREKYCLKNNKDEDQIILTMSLHYDYKEDIHHLNHPNHQINKSNITVVNGSCRKSSSKELLSLEKLKLVNFSTNNININNNKNKRIITDSDICKLSTKHTKLINISLNSLKS